MKLDINAVGDISLGDHPVCVGHGMRSALEKHGRKVYREIEDELISGDINLCNIETVVSNVGFNRYWLPSFEMRGDPCQLSVVKDVGFNVMGVANNHAMQHGVKAFEDMVEQIAKLGVSVIGIECDKRRTSVHEFVHDCEGVSAVFAVSIRPEEWTKDRPVLYSLRESTGILLEEVRQLRSRYSGFLVCSIHWGLEFLEYPAPSQIELGRKLIDAGVDVLFGHHPHVLQPVERYKNGLIFYSLGNFVFDLWPDSTKLTAIAKVRLESGRVPDYKVVPVKIGDDLKLRKADSFETQKIKSLLSWTNYMNREGTPSTDLEYENQYKLERKAFRYSSYQYFLANLRKYPLRFVVQSLARTGLRRILGI
ncbi:CapA family protein [Marinobacter sp. GN3S48]|uniref:CapA family protein n=1 Tax=Marinobacter sp. GN3S48 TaxID=3382302 RepID=UPI00387B7293